MGGDKAGLDVTIHLRDAKGNTIKSLPTLLVMKTELVYDDESPTPFLPLAPLKESKKGENSRHKTKDLTGNSETSPFPLYRPLRPEPVISPSEGSVRFSFRIEEVYLYHPGHNGFKLKVSPADAAYSNIHPACLQATIVVLSKPKSTRTDSSNTEKKEGCRIRTGHDAKRKILEQLISQNCNAAMEPKVMKNAQLVVPRIQVGRPD